MNFFSQYSSKPNDLIKFKDIETFYGFKKINRFFTIVVIH